MATADELIWQNIGPSSNVGGRNAFCAFKVKTVTQNFCRNAYNVSGLCSRQACPLANSKYATVREQEGALYLFMKTPERAHTPAKMWERVKLSSDYTKALSQIDTELAYWPSFLIHKCKQRTTKIVQYLIKIRKLQTRESGRLVPVKKKLERREMIREGKALAAAKLEKNLEKELISRLKSRAYGDLPLNVNEDVWNTILEKEKLLAEAENEQELEFESDEDELENEDSDEFDEDDEEEEEREFVEDLEESDVEDLEDFSGEDDEDDEEDESGEEEDDETLSKQSGKRRALQPSSRKGPQPPSKKRRGARVEIEYEMDGPLRERALA